MIVARLRIQRGTYANYVLITEDHTLTGGYVFTALYDPNGNQVRNQWAQYAYTRTEATIFRTNRKLELEGLTN